MTQVPRAVLRVLAFIMLAVLLVGVPMVLFRLVGAPAPGAHELRGAWQRHQIDSDFVVRIGAAVFAVLWLWFASTAVAELWHVIAWRCTPHGARLSPLPPGPGGVVRALVRFILVSSVTATATLGSVVPLARTSVAAPVGRPTAVSAHASISTVTGTLTMTAPTHLAVGRETPFSLAAMLGRAELRETIIELNQGRVGPDGRVWQGGVFPAGMEVSLPEEQVVRAPMGSAHEVVKGDSYWDIADAHLAVELDREATDHEVLEYTESLMALNHQLLDHRDPALILPGELVVFTAVTSAPTTEVLNDVAVADPPIAVVSDVVVPDVVVPEVAVPDVVAYVPVTPPVVLSPVVEPIFEPPSGQRSPSITAPAGTSGGALPFTAGLGAALMMSAGAVGLLESRRRRLLRSATIGTRLVMPSTLQVRTEVLLRSLSAQERLARLDLALRSAAPSLAAQAAFVQAAVMYDAGDVCLFLRGSATPALAEWKVDLHANTWRLSGAVSLMDLAEHARQCAQPCPVMVHIGGVPEGGELFVDLEAVGVFAVHSPHSAAILRSIAASLAVSPFVEAARVFTVGLGEVALGSPNSESVDSLEAALDAAAISLGSTGRLARGASTFALRVSGAGGEAWEPSVVVALVDDDGVALDGDLRAASAGGRGLAVVIGSSDLLVDGSDATDSIGASWVLRCLDGQHTLEPLGLRVQPVGVSADEVAALRAVLDVAVPTLNHELIPSLLESSETVPLDDVPLDDVPFDDVPFDVVPLDVVPLDDVPLHVDAADVVAPCAAPFVEPQWALMVSVLGPVRVVSAAGVPADCERSKATELIVWLSQHRERPTRSAARTALWDLDVRDATFANVVSDARRALARAAAPADGEEWIARTLTESLPLHSGVMTDAEVLAMRVAHARGLASLDAIDVLRPGVELLLGLPFAGTSYLWTDAEGVTSSLILLATGAATELANHYLLLGDVDGVFWATGQGLKVLSGHEELIALRMRAHARRGDRAGVRGEWESYERAIAADSWAAAEPAPKLVALRRELLTRNHFQQEA